MPEELWTEVHNIVYEAVVKTIPQEEEMQEGKMVVWGGLTNSWEEKQKAKKKNERYSDQNAELQRTGEIRKFS